MAQQHEPVPLGIMLTLCKAGCRATGAVKSFVCHVPPALTACLRYKHLPRSHNLHLTHGFLRATCRKGKRRVKSTRPPFDWACPAILPFQLDLASQVLLDYDEVRRALGHDPDFVVHDYVVAKGDALQPSSKRRLRPMDLPRFSESLLLGMGISNKDVSLFSSYSLRRSMPTAADILKLPEDQCLAIGNWQDRPAGRGERTVAQHYANDKVLTESSP